MTISDDVTDRVQVGGGADLLSLVPFVVGFHPEESVVVMVMREKRLAMTARFDLGAFERPDDAMARFEQIRERIPDCRLILVAYSDDLAAAHDCLALIETLTPGEQIIDSIVCSGERWWSRWCTGDCCPPEGRQLEKASLAAVQAVSLGMSAMPTRRHLEELVAGPSDFAWAELVPMHDRVARRVKAWPKQRRRRRVVALLCQAVSSESADLSLEQTIELAQLVDDIICRDMAWVMIRPQNAEKHQAVWASVVKVTSGSSALPALSLLGVAGWIGGNGALLNCCVERGHQLCEELKTTYSMLDLLTTFSERMVAPSLWTDDLDDPESMPEVKGYIQDGLRQVELSSKRARKGG